ncbi:MAG: hypothetical protein LBO73_04770 [Holosporaceae bacterium]|nr:hypothetical protein [Holosporaceae bacterium]
MLPPFETRANGASRAISLGGEIQFLSVGSGAPANVGMMRTSPMERLYTNGNLHVEQSSAIKTKALENTGDNLCKYSSTS